MLPWREIVERAPHGVFVSDPDGRIRFANLAARVALLAGQHSQAELIGRPLSEVLQSIEVPGSAGQVLADGCTVWFLAPAGTRAAIRDPLGAALRSALLPRPLPQIDGIRVGAAYRAAQEANEIGGDFYELRREDRGWNFSLGDVCGKGIEAAVLTGQVRQSLGTVVLVEPDPVSRLQLLNAALLASGGTSFVTLVHGVICPVERGVAVRMASGGHPPPLLRRQDGRVEEVAVSGPIVGMLPDVKFNPSDFLLEPGETILCFTDGLPDAKGPDGFFGVERLADLLSSTGGGTAQDIADGCLNAALDHLQGRAHDDMAVLTVQAEPVQTGQEA